MTTDPHTDQDELDEEPRAEQMDGDETESVAVYDEDELADESGKGAEEDGYPDSGVAPADELRDLVLYLASSLVDRPDEVEVQVMQRGQAVQLNLVVPEDELGKVIGRQGRIARAIRTVVMIAGSRHNIRASLDIEG